MKKTVFVLSILLSLMLAGSALADVVDLATLHGFTTATGFGFTRSPDTNSGLTTPTITLEFLIPNNESVIFGTVTGTGTGIATAVTPALFSSTAWTTGFLGTYLGLTRDGGPQNPIDAILPYTIGVDAGATGYLVYQAAFGSVTFGSPDPTFLTSGVTLPIGTVILAFVEGQTTNHFQDATASSSVLLVTDDNGHTIETVPEPATLLLLGSGLLGVLPFVRRRFKK